MSETQPLRTRVAACFAELGLRADPRTPDELLRLLRGLHAAGREDLPLGRLYEGHVDAVQIVTRLGAPEQVAALSGALDHGAMLGVWNAELVGEPLILAHDRLTGAKSYASGAGVLTHALVTAAAPEGTRLILLDLGRTPPAIDRDWWRTLGMQRSETHRVRWSGAPVAPCEIIGEQGAYAREPWLSAGALRFVAVQAGGVAALFDRTRDHLLETGRADAPLQAVRLAELYGCAQGAADAVRHAADAWFAAEPERLLAKVAAARVRVAEMADRALAVAQQAVGLQGLFLTHPLSQMVGDLSVYLRQPAPDAQRLRLGAACAQGLVEPTL